MVGHRTLTTSHRLALIRYQYRYPMPAGILCPFWRIARRVGIRICVRVRIGIRVGVCPLAVVPCMASVVSFNDVLTWAGISAYTRIKRGLKRLTRAHSITASCRRLTDADTTGDILNIKRRRRIVFKAFLYRYGIEQHTRHKNAVQRTTEALERHCGASCNLPACIRFPARFRYCRTF